MRPLRASAPSSLDLDAAADQAISAGGGSGTENALRELSPVVRCAMTFVTGLEAH